MELKSDLAKKRNHSDLSETSLSSPQLLPTKLCRMNSDEISVLEEPGEMSLIDCDKPPKTEPTEMSLTDSVKALGHKMDEVLEILKRDQVQTSLDIKTLRDENTSLNLRLNESEGIISHLDSKVKRLELQVESLQTKSMKMNVLFHNFPEKENENCIEELHQFMKGELRIEEMDIFSKQNPGCEIGIDVALRMRKKASKARPIVARFVTQSGRDMVLKRGHMLKGATFTMREHLPPNIRERRMAQTPMLTNLRREARAANTRSSIKLIKDKLIVDNQVKSDVFEKEPLDKNISLGKTIKYEQLFHSSSTTVNGSTFQGHYYPIHSGEEATQALRAIYQNKTLAKSHHVIYAYNYIDPDGQTISGYSDDGEWQTSVMLKDLLEANINSNGILIVTRRHDGPNLGKRRFDLVRDVAREVLGIYAT